MRDRFDAPLFVVQRIYGGIAFKNGIGERSERLRRGIHAVGVVQVADATESARIVELQPGKRDAAAAFVRIGKAFSGRKARVKRRDGIGRIDVGKNIDGIARGDFLCIHRRKTFKSAVELAEKRLHRSGRRPVGAAAVFVDETNGAVVGIFKKAVEHVVGRSFSSEQLAEAATVDPLHAGTDKTFGDIRNIRE